MQPKEINPEDPNTKDPYPDETNPKDLLGVKKAPLHLVPPALRIRTARALADGARKYGAYNWRQKAVKLSVYLAAMQRHIDAYWDGEECAPDSGYPHLDHAAACLAIIMDAAAIGKLVDDRPTKGGAAALLAEQDDTKPLGVCGTILVHASPIPDEVCDLEPGHDGRHNWPFERDFYVAAHEQAQRDADAMRAADNGFTG